MSAAQGWDVTVPEDGAELLAELRRHGITPGQRLHIAAGDLQEVSTHDSQEPRSSAGEQTGAQDGVEASTVRGPQPGTRFAFAGMLKDGPSDLAAHADDYLARGFGRP